jgi:hypothetical protein
MLQSLPLLGGIALVIFCLPATWLWVAKRTT